MEHRKKNSKQLLFLEGINKDTDEEIIEATSDFVISKPLFWSG